MDSKPENGMTEAKRGERSKNLPLCLAIVEPTAEAFVDALRDQADGRKFDRVLLCPDNGLSKSVAEALEKAMPGAEVASVPSPGDESADAWLLCHDDATAQDAALMELADLDEGIVIATKTGHLGLDCGLFLISIPKAGTHLAMEFMRAMGFRDGGELTGNINPGHWHYLEYSNSHTAASDFFNDSVRRAPFGNLLHPFPYTPVLFIYRHPYDILVSEANYYHLEGKTTFFQYLRDLSFEERIIRLIDDPRLLGSLRDRIEKFTAWLEFENVIPVSFEELVGESGGGDASVQRRAIWSVILKLQVTADVETTASRIFNPDSPTFAGGKIGAHLTELSKEAWGTLGRLPSDYLEAFGYQHQPPGKSSTQFGNRIEEFRKRPLRLAAITQESHPPVLIKHDVFGFDLVAYRGSHYAVPSSAGEIDLSLLSPEELAEFLNAASLDELRQILFGRIVSQVHTSGTVRGLVGSQPAPLESFGGYDIYSFNDHLYAVPPSIGVNPAADDFPVGHPGVIIAHSLAGLRLRVFIRKLRKVLRLFK